MKKHIIGTVLFIFLILAQNAFAQSGSFGNNLTWKFNGGTLTISGTGEMPDVISLDNPPWNAHKLNITSVVIENGITAIGRHSFNGYSHTNLQSVTIANTVTRIGSWAFENCKALTAVVIPDSVLVLGNSAFSGCSALASVTIGSGLTKILGEPSRKAA
ncbi:leucine-rich repeat domain-containing protein [Brucepastera parasyntrophica]|uniref:leucine-rich repeat domain-containing protein n=1 Tax=Brucepastera parasyntrophica TaxID=2880008 RepID=UPI00210B0F5F|nr:leucine-rich repeat domain-containing protein [Brucepastera parasyntrophica]ULQ58840.1 leucine-rich repeat domain-containing protein [Brucepastera parasyntrophica]